jgi:glycerol dehydrogenase-like iron-containing ADH family enzyme
VTTGWVIRPALEESAWVLVEEWLPVGVLMCIAGGYDAGGLHHLSHPLGPAVSSIWDGARSSLAAVA